MALHFIALLYPSNVLTNTYMKRFMDNKFLGLRQIQREISVEDVSETIYIYICNTIEFARIS